jgi:thioredoxin 1
MNDQTTVHAQHLTQDDFDQTLQDAGDKPVMVDFYAEWCGPCKLAAPIIDKLSGEFADQMIIAKLDTDENNAVAAKYGVMSIPTVIVFHKGEEIDRKIGFPGEDGYRQMIDQALADAGASMAKAA